MNTIFTHSIGKPLSKIPIMGYKELDLYQLFKEVVAFGGFNEVTSLFPLCAHLSESDHVTLIATF
jgi:hypothetical protein